MHFSILFDISFKISCSPLTLLSSQITLIIDCNGLYTFLVAEMILMEALTFSGLSLNFLPTFNIGINYMKKSTLYFWKQSNFYDLTADKGDHYFVFGMSDGFA